MLKAEDWLCLLLYVGDKVSRPTLANLCAGFEEFECRANWRRMMQRWEQQRLTERATQPGKELVYRLTAQARRRIEPAGNIAQQWDRPWDGRWRVFLFDLPAPERKLRMRLWRWLRDHRFGYLQDSVWIRPDAPPELAEVLTWLQDQPESFVMLDAQRITGSSDVTIVQGAWDFPRINQDYRQYVERVTALESAVAAAANPAQLADLVRRERLAFAEAVALDPLLPRRLWPADYHGPRAVQARQHFQQHVRARLRA